MYQHGNYECLLCIDMKIISSLVNIIYNIVLKCRMILVLFDLMFCMKLAENRLKIAEQSYKNSDGSVIEDISGS